MVLPTFVLVFRMQHAPQYRVNGRDEKESIDHSSPTLCCPGDKVGGTRRSTGEEEMGVRVELIPLSKESTNYYFPCQGQLFLGRSAFPFPCHGG